MTENNIEDVMPLDQVLEFASTTLPSKNLLVTSAPSEEGIPVGEAIRRVTENAEISGECFSRYRRRRSTGCIH